jgi:hypothetical protein
MATTVGKNLSEGQQPMKRRVVLLALLLVIVVAAPSFAHGPMRFIGVVTSRVKDVITVKTVDGKSVTIRIPKDMEVTRNEKPAKLSDIKVNSTVILDGRGDHPGNFKIGTIQLIPPITAKKKPA